MNTVTYIVKPGDTLRRIASQFDIPVRLLLAANPQIDEAEGLVDGEMLDVPVRSMRRYVIQLGDTWESLADKAGCTVEKLREANPQFAHRAPIQGQIWELPPARAERIVRTDAEYGPDQLARDIARLRKTYPFVAASTYGKSVLGRPLHALRIGEGPFRLHVNAACHANEWITSLLLMRFAEEYARACRRKGAIGGSPAADLYRRCTLWLAPMVNPDGVALVQEGASPGHPYYRELLRWNRGSARFRRWKANIRGVDLNDQFPAHWEEERARRGVLSPGPRDYPGAGPLTEPEAKGLAEWTEETDFHAVVALHTQGEEIYWNYRDLEPPEAEDWARRLGAASGYQPVKLGGSDAGFKDWFIARFRRPGFTVEMGWGRNPLPLDGFAELYDDAVRLLTEAMRCGGE